MAATESQEFLVTMSGQLIHTKSLHLVDNFQLCTSQTEPIFFPESLPLFLKKWFIYLHSECNSGNLLGPLGTPKDSATNQRAYNVWP